MLLVEPKESHSVQCSVPRVNSVLVRFPDFLKKSYENGRVSGTLAGGQDLGCCATTLRGMETTVENALKEPGFATFSNWTAAHALTNLVVNNTVTPTPRASLYYYFRIPFVNILLLPAPYIKVPVVFTARLFPVLWELYFPSGISSLVMTVVLVPI